jgi:hypothetical protein
MSANLFAAIRPEEVGANHVGKFICRYSPGGSRGESCRRIDSLLFARRECVFCVISCEPISALSGVSRGGAEPPPQRHSMPVAMATVAWNLRGWHSMTLGGAPVGVLIDVSRGGAEPRRVGVLCVALCALCAILILHRVSHRVFR